MRWRRASSATCSSARRLTAGSPMIADAYAQAYGVRPIPIHNTFSIGPDQRARRPTAALRLLVPAKHSGTRTGPRGSHSRGRGRAGVAGRAAPARGRCRPYLKALRRCNEAVAPKLKIVVTIPRRRTRWSRSRSPTTSACRAKSRSCSITELCLTNKIFTYLAAGVPVISRTLAAGSARADLGVSAFGYDCGDVDGLARVLRELDREMHLRRAFARAARAAATRRWHWEHPDDRGALLPPSRRS